MHVELSLSTSFLLWNYVRRVRKQNNIDADTSVWGQILDADLASLLFLLKHVNVWLKLCPKTGLSDWFVKRQQFLLWEKHLIANGSRNAVWVIGKTFATQENCGLNLNWVRFEDELRVFLIAVVSIWFLKKSEWTLAEQICHTRLQRTMLGEGIHLDFLLVAHLLTLALFAF